MVFAHTTLAMKRFKSIFLLSLLMISCGGKKEIEVDLNLDGQAIPVSSTKTTPTPVVSAIPKPNYNYPVSTSTGFVALEEGSVFSTSPLADVAIDTNAYREATVKGDTVTVNAIDLVVEQGDELVYDRYTSANAPRVLIINAKSVTIRDALILPGSDIVINAQSLVIENNGLIDITPPNVEEDGVNGHNGGKIFLNVENLVNKRRPSEAIFIARGSNGGPAKLGRNGKDGKSVEAVSGYMIFYQRITDGIDIPDFEYPIPTSGEDAVAGGVPGNGGKGGTIISNVELADYYYDLTGGKGAPKAPDYKGGKAGKPVRAYSQIDYHLVHCPTIPRHRDLCKSINSRWPHYFDLYKCKMTPSDKRSLFKDCEPASPTIKVARKIVKKHHTRPGKDAPSPKGGSDGPQGDEPTVHRITEKTPWANIGYAKMLLWVAEDHFIKRNFDVARNFYQEAQAIIASRQEERNTPSALTIAHIDILKSLGHGGENYQRMVGLFNSYGENLRGLKDDESKHKQAIDTYTAGEAIEAELNQHLERLKVRQIERENDFKLAHLDASLGLQKLELGLDYFGHQMGYVPNPSSAQDYHSFVDRVSLAIAIMDEIRKLNKSTAENRKEILRDFATVLERAIEEERNNLNQLGVEASKMEGVSLQMEEQTEEVKDIFEFLISGGKVDQLKGHPSPYLLFSLSGDLRGKKNETVSGATIVDLSEEEKEVIDQVRGLLNVAIPLSGPTSVQQNSDQLPLVEEMNERWKIRAIPARDFVKLKGFLANGNEPLAQGVNYANSELQIESTRWQRGRVEFNDLWQRLQQYEETLPVLDRIDLLAFFMDRRDYNRRGRDITLQGIEGYLRLNKYSLTLNSVNHSLETGEVNTLPIGLYYLANMAKNTLIKYFDLAVRVYQFHVLDSYGDTFPWEEAKSIAGSNTANWQDTFKNLYLRHLGSILEQAYTSPPANEVETVSYSLALNDQELADLNRGERVHIDFSKEAVFREGAREIRIRNLDLYAKSAVVDDVEGDNFNYTLRMVHSNRYNITNQMGQTYYFDMYERNGGKIAWQLTVDGFNYPGEHGQTLLHRDNSFFQGILDSYTREEVNLSAYPVIGGSGNSYLQLEVDGADRDNFRLDYAIIEIEYQYSKRKRSESI